MRVAIITDSIERGPISIGKYTEHIVTNLLEMSERYDLELVLIHGRRDDNDIYKKGEEWIIPYISAKNTHKTLSNAYEITIRALRIIKLCKDQKVDILHFPHAGWCVPPHLPFLMMDPLKLVITLHGIAPFVLPCDLYFTDRKRIVLSKFLMLYWRYFFNKHFAKIIVPSYAEKENIVKTLRIIPEKIKVIYHGIDLERYKPVKIAPEILCERYGVNSPFLFHLSAYQPKKNVENILRALSIMKRDGLLKDHLKLIIGGSQPPHLKRLARDLGIEEETIFMGFIPEQDLPLFYSAAKAFVFPSFHESFGMPILEAMACGCPVITSNVFSLPEIAGDAALLVNPYNPSEIANAINRILNEENLRKELRKKGISRAKNFTWEKCAKKHLEVYASVYEELIKR